MTQRQNWLTILFVGVTFIVIAMTAFPSFSREAQTVDEDLRATLLGVAASNYCLKTSFDPEALKKVAESRHGIPIPSKSNDGAPTWRIPIPIGPPIDVSVVSEMKEDGGIMGVCNVWADEIYGTRTMDMLEEGFRRIAGKSKVEQKRYVMTQIPIELKAIGMAHREVLEVFIEKEKPLHLLAWLYRFQNRSMVYIVVFGYEGR